MRSWFLALFSLVFTAALLEGALRWSAAESDSEPYRDTAVRRAALSQYSADELSTSAPLYLETQGQKCVRRTVPDDLVFHPYFGLHQAQLNRPCAAELFRSSIEHSERIVFLGGSAMANTFAPNSLTTIDSNVARFLNEQGVDSQSLNLAESGSRIYNEFFRLVVDVSNLGATTIVFVDGFNEFSGLRYGIAPDVDYYWGMREDEMLHHPLRHLANGLIARSKLLQLLLWRTGVVKFSGAAAKPISDAAITSAAAAYLEGARNARTWCSARGLRCLFFLQPTIFDRETPDETERRILTEFERVFPGWNLAVQKGFDEILRGADFPLVLLRSQVSAESEQIFIDDVHLTKSGNRVVGEAIAREILKGVQ